MTQGKLPTPTRLGTPITPGAFDRKGKPSRKVGTGSRKQLGEVYRKNFSPKRPRKINRPLDLVVKSAGPIKGIDLDRNPGSPRGSGGIGNRRKGNGNPPGVATPIDRDRGGGSSGGGGGKGGGGGGGGHGKGHDHDDDHWKYKYKYKYKYRNGRGHGYQSWWDAWLWRINIHSYLGFHYYPHQYGWYSRSFGYHPSYSSYWWCEWWPYYSVYPGWVAYYPTYVGVPTESTSTIIYYPYYDAPSSELSYGEPGSGMALGDGSMPQQEISPEFASELDALAANTDAVALMEEGALLFRQGDFAGAADAFRKAVLAEKANAVPKFAMAHALFALGEYEYAAFMIRRGMEILPSWPSVGADLRDLYGNPDDLTEQTIALQIYLDTHPESVEAALLSGYVSFFSGDLDGAEGQFKATAEADPADSVAALFLTRITEIRGLLEDQGVEAGDPSELAPKAPTPNTPKEEASLPEPAGDGN